uniref:CC domain-containing protein n=1 Tax=Syphacia muris TaxID=451379 RepID=A0A0N5A7U5_9BILA
MCVNGGMMVNVGCSTDTTCRLYNANWVCIQGCCCTIPRFYTPTSFYPMNSTPAIDFNKFRRRETSSKYRIEYEENFVK